MTIYKNISSTWTQMSDIYANNGSWQLCKSVWRNVSGTWQCIHNAGYAIIGGGRAGSRSATTEKYTYAIDGVAAGTSLATARELLTATGNQVVGIFGGGYTTSLTNVTDIYTYSSDGVASGTNLGSAIDGNAAAGNITYGVFACGRYNSSYNYITNAYYKYTYSNNAVTSGNLISSRWRLAAVGNDIKGIFGGGEDDGGPTITYGTQKLTYSNSSVAGGGVYH